MKNTNPTEDVWTLRKKAGALRKAQRYEEALEPYRMLWEQSTQQDAWDGWGYAFCLEKTGQTTPALEVCRKAHELDPEHELVRQLYARCLYYVEVRAEQTSLGRQMQAARLIGELVAQDDPYAPYLVPSILHVATALKERGRFRDVLEWLDRLDPSRLSTEPFQLEEKGRTIKIPSEATRYWLLRCKALFRTGDFAGCREAVEQALQQVPRPVNDADLWWRRLKALAQAVEGDLETAYRELSRLAARKPAWFLEEDLARIARKQGNHDVAWRHLLRVLLDRSPLRLRVNAVERVAAWYEEEGEAERARQTLA
ncbi:MAG: tetratricopeptide repeat protein, partial [Bacteroidetes bacterium]